METHLAGEKFVTIGLGESVRKKKEICIYINAAYLFCDVVFCVGVFKSCIHYVLPQRLNLVTRLVIACWPGVSSFALANGVDRNIVGKILLTHKLEITHASFKVKNAW